VNQSANPMLERVCECGHEYREHCRVRGCAFVLCRCSTRTERMRRCDCPPCNCEQFFEQALVLEPQP
jgi:hypothetical protein